MERSANPSRGGRTGNRRPSSRTAAAHEPPVTVPPITGNAAAIAAVAELARGLDSRDVAANSSLRRTMASTERPASRSARTPQGRGQQAIADRASPGAAQPCIADTGTIATR